MCVINVVLVTNPKYSAIKVTVKKIKSIPAKINMHAKHI